MIIDDGSTDKSSKICNSFKEIDDRICIIAQNYRGLSAARNVGLEFATGDFISFGDADDYINYDLYENCVKYLFYLKNKPGLIKLAIIFEYKIIDGLNISKTYLPNRIVESIDSSLELLINNKNIGNIVWNKLYSRDLFDKTRFDESRDYEDLLIQYKIFTSARKIMLCSFCGYNYDRKPGSITKNYSFSLKNRFDFAYAHFFRARNIECNNRGLLNKLAVESVDSYLDFIKYYIKFPIYEEQFNRFRNELKENMRTLSMRDVGFANKQILRLLAKKNRLIDGMAVCLRYFLGKIQEMPARKIIILLMPYFMIKVYEKYSAFLLTRIKTYTTLHYFQKYKKEASVAKLQIGAGANILDGWFNTDIVPDRKKKIHFLDLAWCFPFPEESFEYIFSEHSLEHLSFNEGLFMLRECWRVLKHNGKIRIATPDLNKLMTYYANESKLHSDYSEFEYEHFIKHKIARDILTKDIVLNNFFRDWGHKFIYDSQTITCALQDAGFVNIKTYGIGVSDDAAFVGLEQHGNIISDEFNELETMIVEAVKP